jgi:hypothetical protein
LSPTHTIGHEQQEGTRTAVEPVTVGVGNAGTVNFHDLVQRSDQELILVVLSDLSNIGQSVDVNVDSVEHQHGGHLTF